jgi:peptide/nickel transport system ATP-binding protein
MTAASPLLRIRDLGLELATDDGPGQVLDHVDFDVDGGEIVGLVGESGCGKSTLARLILGIAPPGARVSSGEIRFDGEDVLALGERELAARIRASRIGYVPQDPFQSFNPLFRVGAQLLEIMRWHAAAADGRTRRQHRARLLGLMDRVGIAGPEAALRKFPHEFSGGQLQRLVLVAALACRPALVLADEPTSALDVTTQQQVLTLLDELVRETGAAMLLVTHDFGVVSQYCDRVTVMYAGQTVETLARRDLVDGARHPYTRMLLDCHPDRGGALAGIPGIVPSVARMPAGCRFHPRCPSATAACARTRPEALRAGPEHAVSCHVVARDLASGAADG